MTSDYVDKKIKCPENFFFLLSVNNLHVYTVHQQYQILYCPTDALNYINYRIIKNTLKP